MGDVPNDNALKVSRRSFVAGGTAALVATSLPAGAAIKPDDNVVNFMKTAAVLTGIEINKSYFQLAEVFMKALDEVTTSEEQAIRKDLVEYFKDKPLGMSGDEITSLLKSKGDGYIDQGKKIAKLWYTGKITLKDGSERVITYDEALVWQACDFTKPPATCGGLFGYWQHPYAKGA